MKPRVWRTEGNHWVVTWPDLWFHVYDFPSWWSAMDFALSYHLWPIEAKVRVPIGVNVKYPGGMAAE